MQKERTVMMSNSHTIYLWRIVDVIERNRKYIKYQIAISILFCYYKLKRWGAREAQQITHKKFYKHE